MANPPMQTPGRCRLRYADSRACRARQHQDEEKKALSEPRHKRETAAPLLNLNSPVKLTPSRVRLDDCTDVAHPRNRRQETFQFLQVSYNSLGCRVRPLGHDLCASTISPEPRNLVRVAAPSASVVFGQAQERSRRWTPRGEGCPDPGGRIVRAGRLASFFENRPGPIKPGAGPPDR